MNTKILSSKLVRVLVILALVVPLVLGGLTPAKATATYTVIGWGDNTAGQLNIPSNLTDVVAIAAGHYHSLALKSDGTVVGWGTNNWGQLNIPPDLTDVVAIAAGPYHSLALKSNGTVVGWGDNTWGELNIPPDLTDVVTIAIGIAHSLALKSDGTVVGWGNNSWGELNIPPDLTDVVAIAAGGDHSLAAKNDGTVVGWGWNGNGQATPPAGLTNVVAVAAGANHSIALKADGTIAVWGTSGNPGVTDIASIAGNFYHSLVLKNDGTVFAWGNDYYGEGTVPPGLTGVVAIAAGSHHNLALVPADNPANTAPTANPGGPYLGAVNTAISFDGSLSSDLENDTLTYTWDFGDGSATSPGVAPAHSYTAAGIYNVCLTVDDGSLSSIQVCTMAVVYDPSAGFVTGGGWIDSPAGAFKANESLAGKATFGFMSKYQKGASGPTGNTAFQFDLAGLAFSSTSYEWLVVNQSGMNAQFKGSGMINAAPDPNGNAYKFMLWAGDGSPDTLRIRIWWEDTAGEHDVYDNGTNQAIGAGNIVVHTGK